MLGQCRDHARAFCRISIAELRRVAPPAFYVLMVISLLLADGLFPVFATKHRPQGSLYASTNLARATSGVDNDVVLYARSNNNNNNNNNRYRTKVRVKPLVSKKGDSVMSGGADENGKSNVGIDSGNTRLMRSHLHLQPHVRDIDASEGGGDRRREKDRTDNRRSNSGSSDNNVNDYEQLSLHLDERSASSSIESYPSSFSSSPSSSSSLKPSPSFSSMSSPSLTSESLSISNSSNNIEGFGYPSDVTISGTSPNDTNACLGVHQLISLPGQNMCETLSSSKQCLLLTASTAEVICGKCQKAERIEIMRNDNLHLRFCSSFDAGLVSCASNIRAVGDCPLNESPSQCLDYLKDIVASDNLSEEMYAGFQELIGRYDCKSNYSVKWQCHHCKQAYRDWLCSQNIKFVRSGKVVPPCMEFCSHVEEMCPFFRPKLDSYAGDHSFICKDPHMNLPSTMPEENCYGLCDLWPRLKITNTYCSHANLNSNNCPLLAKCDQDSEHQTTGHSNISIISNNTTSGSSPVSTLSRTPTLSSFILPVFCMLTASLFRLPVTVTESRYIPEGLT